jgi:sulfide:quinone oxidoreductase
MSGGASKRVVICGGGVAGVETLLALHAHVQVGVEVHLVSRSGEFVYQPLAVAAPFGETEVHRFDLADIAAGHGAQLHLDALERIDPEAKRIALASGVTLDYDALVLAVGARPREWLSGALHFAGADDVASFRAMLQRIEGGSAERVVFANPAGVAWTLPLYELALLTASHLADAGVVGPELVLVTPEQNPLSVFGSAASRALRDLLSDRGVQLRVGVEAYEIDGGEVRLRPTGAVRADQVVTLAKLEGPAIDGVPADATGFIQTDAHGRVVALSHVYAAGDGTTFPVKQGGIAAQQADAVAEAIAAELGAAIEPKPVKPTLRGMLLTGITPLYLRTTIASSPHAADTNGNGNSGTAAVDPLWWPASKIAGRYLAPYLASHVPLESGRELADREPSKLSPRRLAESHDEARALAVAFAERDASEGDFSSALDWLEVIEHLDGVLPVDLERKRKDWHERAGVA